MTDNNQHTNRKAKQKITPNLWFDTQAEEAAAFYVSVFKHAKLGEISRYDEAAAEVSGQPEGSAMTVPFELEGQPFLALNGGPHFTFNPSISFFVGCRTKAEVDDLWEKLSDGGTPLMPLDAYPFSERYGWLQDQYGLSWQVMFVGDHEITQKITPALMFVGERAGHAEAAMEFYTSLFDEAHIGGILRYEKGEAPDEEGTVKHAEFTLAGHRFMAMDSAREHNFSFNEAISFIVDCRDQAEVDYFWNRLTDGGEEGPCGWLKDGYGVSWQIIPRQLTEMLTDEDRAKAGRVMRAMLQMKKIDINGLKQAYEQEPHAPTPIE